VTPRDARYPSYLNSLDPRRASYVPIAMTSDYTKDPRLWTIEQVKRWAQSTFPFGDTLAQSLVENDVDGSVLLTHITDDTLKSDIGLKSLGQRVKVLGKVEELRALICIAPSHSI
jgi:hypothetical protein